MKTSESRPFTAATSKFAYAQAFAAPKARSHSGARPSAARFGRGLVTFRARHKSSRAA